MKRISAVRTLYKMKLIRFDGIIGFLFGWIFNKKIKKVYTHIFPKDIPQNNFLMLIILDNNERFLINIKSFKYIWFSKEWYEQEVEIEMMESNGVAKPNLTEKIKA